MPTLGIELCLCIDVINTLDVYHLKVSIASTHVLSYVDILWMCVVSCIHMGPNDIKWTNVFTLHLGLLSFLGSFCQKKHVCIKRNLKWNILKISVYCIYSCPNMTYVFFNKFWIIYFFWKCIDFSKLCVSSWKIITILNHTKTCFIFSSLTSYIISYNFVLKNIYIASYLHVINDSWIIFKP